MTLTAQLHERVRRMAFHNRFWAIYPHKVAKKEAEAAFVKLIATQADLDAIMANTPKWAAAWDCRTEVPPPYPATYLNRGQWQDPPPEAEFRGRRRVAQQQEDRTPPDITISVEERRELARSWAGFRTHMEWPEIMANFAQDPDPQVSEIARRALGISTEGGLEL